MPLVAGECVGRSEARTQGAPVSADTGATEDAVLGASSAALRHRLYFAELS
jgi:hypothetical protein